jgi:hypothetical protein
MTSKVEPGKNLHYLLNVLTSENGYKKKPDTTSPPFLCFFTQ